MNKDYNFNYDSKNRWVSYWHQIDEVLALAPDNVLEVGIGNQTTANYLKAQGIKVVTLDINKDLSPDIVANVLEMPLEDNSFDVALCAEVLEHLPFEKFEKGLRELKRVSKGHVVLSLPHFGHSVEFSFKIPFFRRKKIAWRIPFPIRHKYNGDHYWEIGKRGYALPKIKNIIKKYFKIKKDFIPFENQYHHFFVLENI